MQNSETYSPAEQRLVLLEKGFIGHDHRLDTSEKILTEIKNVLIEQNKTMTEIIRLQERQHSLEETQNDLKRIFKEREDETNPEMDKINAFINKIIGGLVVLTFIIAGFGWYVKMNADQLHDQYLEIQTTNKRINSVESEYFQVNTTLINIEELIKNIQVQK